MPPSLHSPAEAYCEIDLPDAGGRSRTRAAFERPAAILMARSCAEVPSLLAAVDAHARGGGWAAGFVAYEAAAAFDAALPTQEGRPGELPLAAFALYEGTAPAARPRGDFLPGAWRDETTPPRFDAIVAAIRQGITAGDYYQVNATTRLRAPLLGDALALWDRLRASQPEAYCAFLDFGRWQVCCVSPELFFRWDRKAGRLRSRPMKGTAARAADPGQDEKSALALRRSPKECAENLMIVDLIRNDLSRVAQLGSVAVPELLTVEAWPTVWQMTSTVDCTTRPGTTLAEVFGALFPCGSVTGAPKRAAMAAIAALEASPRGAYCGAIGLVTPGGDALFSVGIRTVLVDAATHQAECGIGSGITLDSNATDELAEWQAKQRFLHQACPDYELLETLCLHGGRYWLRRGHLLRLADSAATLGFACDLAAVDAALAAEASRRPAGRWRVRLRLAPDGGLAVESFALEPMPSVVDVAWSLAPVSSANPWLQHKTTQRSLYDGLTCADAFDTLLWNERGEVTEFTRGNVVADIDGRLLTPPRSCGLLPGVLRAALLARRRVVEGVIRREDLSRARRLWFVNSVRGALPATLAG